MPTTGAEVTKYCKKCKKNTVHCPDCEPGTENCLCCEGREAEEICLSCAMEQI